MPKVRIINQKALNGQNISKKESYGKKTPRVSQAPGHTMRLKATKRFL